MKQLFRLFAAPAALLILGGGAGCGARNIYRNAKFQKPPLVAGYVHTTREGTLDAGVEPVEGGQVLATADTVYVASETNGIEAFDRANFARRWRFAVKNGVSGQVVLESGILYFGAEDGVFYAVDAEFGRLNWKYETKAPVFAAASILGGKIFVSASDDVLYCLDKASGKWIWHYKRGGNYITTVRGNSTAAVFENQVLVGFSDGYLVALNLADGNLKWEVKVHSGTKFTDVDALPMIEDRRIYIPSYDGSLYALEAANGKVLWHVDVGGSRKVVIEDKTLYLASSDGHVYALNKDSGKILWKFELDRGVPTDLVLRQNYVAFGGSQEYFYVIHKGDGSLAYRFDAGLRSGFISAPAQSGNEIFILSGYGNVYTFRWREAGLHGRYFQWQ